MKSTIINSLFQKLSDSIPKAETELCYRNPFELLIAVILSAQATDVSVNKVTPELFSAFPTPVYHSPFRWALVGAFLRAGPISECTRTLDNKCKFVFVFKDFSFLLLVS